MLEDSIYTRLGLMAVAHARVVDPATVPGRISLEVNIEDWKRDIRSADFGYFDMYTSKRSRPGFVENVIVVLTRALVDTNIEVGDLFDFVESEARALPTWTEQSAVREPSGPRSVGAAVQSGCYRDAGQGWLFTATKYAVYQRANVVYLLQCTATSASQDQSDWARLSKVVRSARFED